MIDRPTKRDLVELISQENGLCVSILMPTHERGRETSQDPIRFKNLIKRAGEQIGDRSEKLRDRLESLSELENDSNFWRNRSAGLALFVSESSEQQMSLAFAPEETVCVSEQFYLLPIAAEACGLGTVLALTLSWEHAALLESDGHQIHEIANESFPLTMDDLVTERDPEEQLQFSKQSPQRGAGVGSRVMYHGQGEGEDKIEADRDMYLSRIGKRLADILYNTTYPLIVVATDEVAGHFTAKAIVKVEEVVHGSPDGLPKEQLHARINDTACRLLKRSGKALQESLETAVANESGSKEIKNILVKAASGLVDTLLLGDVQPDGQTRGTFDRESLAVHLDDQADTDLVNLAVRETLVAGGTVVRVSELEERVAAISTA